MADKKMHSNESDIVTINLQPLLMPFALLLSAIVISLSFLAGMNNLANAIEDGGVAVGNSDNGNAAADGDTAPTTGDVSIDDDPYLGNKDKAKVAIVEFSDYECPFCGRFHTDTFDQIIENYVDSGDAIFVYRDFPLSFHPSAEKMAIAAECVDELKDNKAYYDFGGKVFNVFNGGSTPTDDQLKQFAKEVGVSESKFEDCLDDEKFKEEVAADMADGQAAGISGTPGFIVGVLDEDGNVSGEIISGAQPYSIFSAAIERQLENAK